MGSSQAPDSVAPNPRLRSRVWATRVWPFRNTPSVGNVHDDWLEPVPNLKLDIDQDRARALGVTSQTVRRSLQAMLSGFQIGEFRDSDETIKVMLRAGMS